jgi:hypothetical protein
MATNLRDNSSLESDSPTPTYVLNTQSPYAAEANCPKPTPTCGVHNRLPYSVMVTKMGGGREV